MKTTKLIASTSIDGDDHDAGGDDDDEDVHNAAPMQRTTVKDEIVRALRNIGLAFLLLISLSGR